MEKSPPVNAIKQWLIAENPLNVFQRKEIKIKDIDPKPWSGHFNYLVTVGRKKFVLRFRGPEWGTERGIKDEFEILQAAGAHRVGPQAYWLGEGFFGEHVMLQEYLNGAIFPDLLRRKQDRLFPKVARFIAKINTMRFPKGVLSLEERLMSYLRHKETWRWRLETMLLERRSREVARRIEKLLPRAEELLHRFDKRLQRVLKKTKPAFIFESAHAGHLMRIHRGGFRFVNWEKVSFGDPSFSLAVFLASIQKRRDFTRVKERMIRSYLRKNPVPEFREMLEDRLKERAISNLLWVGWAYVMRKDPRPIESATSIVRRLRDVERILRSM